MRPAVCPGLPPHPTALPIVAAVTAAWDTAWAPKVLNAAGASQPAGVAAPSTTSHRPLGSPFPRCSALQSGLRAQPSQPPRPSCRLGTEATFAPAISVFLPLCPWQSAFTSHQHARELPLHLHSCRHPSGTRPEPSGHPLLLSPLPGRQCHRRPGVFTSQRPQCPPCTHAGHHPVGGGTSKITRSPSHASRGREV